MGKANYWNYQGAYPDNSFDGGDSSNGSRQISSRQNIGSFIVDDAMKHVIIGGLIGIICCFSLVAGSCISFTVEHSKDGAECHAIMTVLLSKSFSDLGEIRVVKI